MKDINKIFIIKKSLDLFKLPEKYKKFADFFSRELSDKLFFRRFYNYKILLILDAVFLFNPLYNIF